MHNKAVETGHAPANDIFAHVQTANVRTAKRAISVKDIRKIENLDLPTDSSLDKARDLFLLSFYLRGMAFVDMAFWKKTDLKCSMVNYNRRKTHQKPQCRVDEANANHHRQVRQTNEGLPLPATHPDRQGILPYTAYRKVEHNTNYNLKKIGEKVGLKIPLHSPMWHATHGQA